MGKRRSFTAEFKQEAVQLAQQPDVALSQVARDLELSESLLRRWVTASDQKGEAAFPGKSKLGDGGSSVQALNGGFRAVEATTRCTRRRARRNRRSAPPASGFV